MRITTSLSARWKGRKTVAEPEDQPAGIPVPPFADQGEAQRFLWMLQLFLSELKQPGDPVGLHQFLLAQVLEWHRPDNTCTCFACGAPYPCRTVLGVAVLARFPVPWSPATLVRALRSVGLLPVASDGDGGGDGDGDNRLELDPYGDPQQWATRTRDGGWILETRERGSVSSRELPDDRSLYDFLADRVRSFPYPYGRGVDASWLPAVRQGAGAAQEWWTGHAALPYLETHRADGAFPAPPAAT